MSVGDRCEVCRQPVDLSVGQSIGPGNLLMWSRASICGSCGAVVEEDNMGLPPPSLRQRIMGEQGVWTVSLKETTDRLRAVSAIKTLLELDHDGAVALLKRSSSTLWSGTKIECKWMALHLEKLGITVVITREKAGETGAGTEEPLGCF